MARRDEAGYDWLFEGSNHDNRTGEMIAFEHLMKQYKEVNSLLIDNKIIPVPRDSIVSSVPVENTLDCWVKRCFFLLRSATSLGKPVSQLDPHKMDNFSLFCRFLILSLLDPSKEQTIIPIMALYLIDKVPAPNETSFEQFITKEKILAFLYQYSLRSPSIFFIEFNLKNFKAYITEDPFDNAQYDTFSVLDLILRFYFMRLETMIEKNETDRILLKLINYLFDIRFSMKEKIIPTFFTKPSRDRLPTNQCWRARNPS